MFGLKGEQQQQQTRHEEVEERSERAVVALKGDVVAAAHVHDVVVRVVRDEAVRDVDCSR